MTPAHEFRALRESLGRSRHALGELFGLRYPSVMFRETGKTAISLEEMDRLREMVAQKEASK